MNVECRAYFEFRSRQQEVAVDPKNWTGLVQDLAVWLDQLPNNAMVDVAYPIGMGTNSLVARWNEER